MLEQATTPNDALRMPGEIDAHLMFVALDAVPVVLQAGNVRVPGRFDLADGFGEIAFIDQRTSTIATVLSPGEVTAEYYLGGSSLHRFSTRVIARSVHDRVRLARPRLISRAERRIVPRFQLVDASSYSFTFSEPEEAVPAEVVDLSNTGAQLLVSCSLGLTGGGQSAAGWLRLGADSEPVPVTVEVRHVAPFDADRVSVGVRFAEIRQVDQVRLTRHVVGLPEGHVA